MANKIIGYILLASGICIILWTAWQSYGIFTGQKSVVQIFKTPEAIKESSQSVSSGILGILNVSEKSIQDAIGKQIEKILPADTLAKFLNLACWSILAGILIFSGSSLASLGIKLLRG